MRTIQIEFANEIRIVSLNRFSIRHFQQKTGRRTPKSKYLRIQIDASEQIQTCIWVTPKTKKWKYKECQRVVVLICSPSYRNELSQCANFPNKSAMFSEFDSRFILHSHFRFDFFIIFFFRILFYL